MSERVDQPSPQGQPPPPPVHAGNGAAASALHLPFKATLFPYIAAKSMTVSTFTLSTLAQRIASTRAATKQELPWIKLAGFGSARSDKGSLRTNANVTELWGLEGDHDLGTVTVDQAERLLKQAGIAAIIYTSASHTPAAPRWRVLVLCSRPLPPSERDTLIGRLNGALRACLSAESQTLSQAYYYGQVPGSAFDLRLIDGEPIDLLAELDAGAIMPRPRRSARPSNGSTPAPPAPSEAFSEAQRDKLVDRILTSVRRAGDGQRHHARRDAGKLLGGLADALGLSDDEIVALVIDANPPADDEDKEERAVRDGIAYGRKAPIALGESMAKFGLRADQDFQHVKPMPLPGTEGDKPRPTPPPPPPEPHEPPAGGGGQDGEAGEDEGDAADEGATEDEDEPQIPVRKLRTVGQWVNYLNRRYMIVNEAGRCLVYERVLDPILNRYRYVRIKFDDFRRLYMNKFVRVGTDGDGNPVLRPVANVWLYHQDRREYVGGLVFDPTGKHVPHDAYNLWTGFKTKAAAGSWALMREHILRIVCNEDEELFKYVLGWLARMVQRPNEPGHTALVLQGEEGSGKGAFATMIREMLGQHSLAISNTKHLTGNFNSHLADCLFLFADEALVVTDKQAQGVIKALITEPTLFIERKGSDGIQMPNFLHIVMASNNDWVVPAGLSSRRYVVLVQSKARIKDVPYFKALYAEIEGGGVAAMLHDLLHYDISDFVVQRFPMTEGLQEQRKLSLTTELRWWHDCLSREFVYESEFGLPEFAEWKPWMATDLLFTSYEKFVTRQRERAMSREAFGKLMGKLGALPVRPRGECLIGETKHRHSGTPTALMQNRARGYFVGLLDDARAQFADHTGLRLDWPADE